MFRTRGSRISISSVPLGTRILCCNVFNQREIVLVCFRSRKPRWKSKDPELLARVLFQFHVTRRLMESLFVKVNKKKAQMHAIGYVLGLLYYVCATLSLNSNNEEKGERKADFFFASLLFFYANWKQYECHVLLRNARLQTDRRDQYAQIDSGLFSLVACPHYFFECVLYFSLCIILRCSKSSALMFPAVFAET